MTLVAFLNGVLKKVHSFRTSPVSDSGAKELVSGYIKSRFISDATVVNPLLKKHPVGELIGLSATMTLLAPASKHNFATARNASG